METTNENIPEISERKALVLEFIKCPECGSIELATVNHSTFPFSTWIHVCLNCDFIIQESDWEPIKALSIKQPHAWLVLNGFKPIENRDTLKNFRGDFLIHAGLQFDKDWRKSVHPHIIKLINTVIDSEYQYFKKGGIIGSATITDCVQESYSPWFVGKNGFIIVNPKPLPFTPCTGKLSFFKPEIL